MDYRNKNLLKKNNFEGYLFDNLTNPKIASLYQNECSLKKDLQYYQKTKNIEAKKASTITNKALTMLVNEKV